MAVEYIKFVDGACVNKGVSAGDEGAIKVPPLNSDLSVLKAFVQKLPVNKRGAHMIASADGVQKFLEKVGVYVYPSPA